MATWWGVNSEVRERAQQVQRQFLAETGVRLILTSGKRSAKKQRDLQRRYEAGERGIYRPARISAHVYGFAVDMAPEGVRWPQQRRLWNVYWRLARAAGFRVIGPRDPVHIEAPDWRRVAGV